MLICVSLSKVDFVLSPLLNFFRDEELLVNNDDANDDDCDDDYIDNDEDVRTLKNPALEELSPGNLCPPPPIDFDFVLMGNRRYSIVMTNILCMSLDVVSGERLHKTLSHN